MGINFYLKKFLKLLGIAVIIPISLFESNKKDEIIRRITKILDIFKFIFYSFLIHIIKDNIFYFLN